MSNWEFWLSYGHWNVDGEGQDSRYFFHDFQRLYCIKLLTAASIVLAAGLQAALFFKAAATEKDWCLFLVPCADGALGWFCVGVPRRGCRRLQRGRKRRSTQPAQWISFISWGEQSVFRTGATPVLVWRFFYLLFIVWQRLPIKRLGPCAFICKSNLNFSYSAIV